MAFTKGCEHAHVVPEKIKKWLIEEEMAFVQLIGNQARNALFNYLVTLPSEIKVNVVQSTHRKDSVCVSAVLPFSEEQKNEKLFSKLRFKLAPVNVTVTIGANKVIVSHTIYYDGLTKDRLFHAMSAVEKAYILGDLTITKS